MIAAFDDRNIFDIQKQSTLQQGCIQQAPWSSTHLGCLRVNTTNDPALDPQRPCIAPPMPMDCPPPPPPPPPPRPKHLRQDAVSARAGCRALHHVSGLCSVFDHKHNCEVWEGGPGGGGGGGRAPT